MQVTTPQRGQQVTIPSGTYAGETGIVVDFVDYMTGRKAVILTDCDSARITVALADFTAADAAPEPTEQDVADALAARYPVGAEVRQTRTGRRAWVVGTEYSPRDGAEIVQIDYRDGSAPAASSAEFTELAAVDAAELCSRDDHLVYTDADAEQIRAHVDAHVAEALVAIGAEAAARRPAIEKLFGSVPARVVELTDLLDGNTATVPADQVADTVRGWYGGPGPMLEADSRKLDEFQAALLADDRVTAADIAGEIAVGFDLNPA